ncbi:MAG: DUF4242 domain-containing protein [Anaerolineales bacterium]|nr:DUF4242 domain-containing protein [Anaerolineales bacterium]
MPRFLVVHRVAAYPDSQEHWIKILKQLRQRTSEDVEWVRTFFDPNAGEMYCEWEADNDAAIRACFTEEDLRMVPIESIREIVMIDPSWLEESTP